MTNEKDTEMDPNGLFREENFTDQKLGTIRKLVPIKADGSDDPDREDHFFGAAQVMTPMGALPLNFHSMAIPLAKRPVILPARRRSPLKRPVENWKKCAVNRRHRLLFPARGGGGMGVDAVGCLAAELLLKPLLES